MSEVEQTSEPVAEATPAPAVAKPAPKAAPVVAIDPAILDTTFYTGYHASKRPAEILPALLAGTGIALGTVTDQPDLRISAIRFDGEPLRACLDKLARPLGAKWTLNGAALDFTFEVA